VWNSLKHGPQVRIGADSTLRNFLSPKAEFQFLVPLFGALYLPNLTESARVPIRKVVVLTSISNFVNFNLELDRHRLRTNDRQKLAVRLQRCFSESRLQCFGWSVMANRA